MYPSARDNFGVDSCALLVLPTNPMTIVIAEPTGKMYHAILVESSFNEQENVSIKPVGWTDVFSWGAM